MTVMRGRVTSVDPKGVYVRAAVLGPDVVGPLEWLGVEPAPDDAVLILNAGADATPDLVVLKTGAWS